MDAFLSYSSADKKLAKKLREELTRSGLSVWWDDDSDQPGEAWRRQVKEAIRSSDYILVLVGPRAPVDEAQDLTWRVALETVWKDPRKRLIPILLRGAQLPAFIHSGTSGKVRGIEVENSRDVQSIAQAVLALLEGRKAQDQAGVVRTREFRRDDNERANRLSEMADALQSMIASRRDSNG